MRERFMPEEWEVVKALPFAVFGAVASADGEVDDKEIKEFTDRMGRAAGYKDPLHREAMTEAASSDVSGLVARAGAIELEKTRTFLQEKLSHDEYQSFMGSIFIDAAAVAKSSGGGGLFRKKDKIGDKESKILQGIAVLFQIDIENLSKYFG